ncbi:MAG: (2Fe-2S)-binding protein [Saprospiraceae bacterium]|nr:(2Fe-2S)-binding protein [Saprospiraceae bacterium]
MNQFRISVNGKRHSVNAAPGTSLLWVLRDHLGLTGTKYGCGIAQCGACTIHLNGNPVRACVLPIDGVEEDQEITTIEGLDPDGSHPLQKSWIEAQVPQCGYCHSGQIMQAAALLSDNQNPTREEIKQHMNPILCRCGTYLRIIKAIEIAASAGEVSQSSDHQSK